MIRRILIASLALFWSSDCLTQEHEILYIEFDQLVHLNLQTGKSVQLKADGQIFDYAVQDSHLIVAMLPHGAHREQSFLYYSSLKWIHDSSYSDLVRIAKSENVIGLSVSPNGTVLVSLFNKSYKNTYSIFNSLSEELEEIPELAGTTFIDWLSSGEALCRRNDNTFAYDFKKRKTRTIWSIASIPGDLLRANDTQGDTIVISTQHNSIIYSRKDSVNIHLISKAGKKLGLPLTDVRSCEFSRSTQTLGTLLTCTLSDEFHLYSVTTDLHIRSINVSYELKDYATLQNVILSANSSSTGPLLYVWALDKGGAIYLYDTKSNKLLKCAMMLSSSREIKKLTILKM